MTSLSTTIARRSQQTRDPRLSTGGLAGHWGAKVTTPRRWRCRFKTVNGFEPPIITAEIGYAEGASGDRKAALESAHMLQGASAHIRMAG
jgi:hypothetical protein